MSTQSQQQAQTSTRELLFKAKPSRFEAAEDYAKALAVVAVCTIIDAALYSHVHRVNLIMVYLLGVVCVGVYCNRLATIMACVLSVAFFDYLYVPPMFKFVPADSEYLFTLAVMLLVSLALSNMAANLKQTADVARKRQDRTETLCSLSEEFSSTRLIAAVAQVAVKHTDPLFDCHSTVYREVEGRLEHIGGAPVTEDSLNRIARIYAANKDDKERRGLIKDSELILLPLHSSAGSTAIGVLAIVLSKPNQWDDAQSALLMAFGHSLSIALDRVISAEAASRARFQVETMKLRNALLSSVSHDLRTPLAAIMGAASSMLGAAGELPEETRRELAQSIYDEAERLSRFLKNLLDMTRLESGAIRLKKDWQSIEEAVGAALHRMRHILSPFTVRTQIPADLTLVPFDDTLIDQVITNLFDNACKYAPAGSEILIKAHQNDDGVTLGVSNQGATLEPGSEDRIFDKFFRAHSDSTYGTGLGLAICKGIIQAHGGKIWAELSEQSTITIYFTLPLPDEPPPVPLEEMEEVV